jgi:RNA polymerase sigma-70 factor (ECF subfamily)
MDRELVERAMDGDHAAFALLAGARIRRLLAIARLILRDQARAEDVTQEALVNAWTHLRGLRDPDRFDAWLKKLLVTGCYRESKRGRRRAAVELRLHQPEWIEAAPATGEMASVLADRDALERGFRRLDIEQRSILVLHYFHGHSLDEIGEVLGLKPGTVRSKLHRAIQAMRAGMSADARSPLLDAGTRA